MELTLTVLMKAIMLHWGGGGGGGGSSSGDKQLETQEKYCKFKMHQLLPPSFHVTITLAGYSNLTGSHFFRVRSIFIFQAECVHMYMDFF